ncbi:ABC transporter permease [uncultured Erythrobacter sp.]|uniref:ABC transporter permease n=1 Tax=uncultured Erythrobacter sp. TaxID=263913 RepID=UPI00265A6572|nr:ABC transporter permease [uncultured Erythrobacter sp.]
MARFVLQRLAFLWLVLLGVSLITFAIAHLAPGDPARMMAGPAASADAVAALRAELGLDLPLWQQYARYLGDLLRFDLGTSNVSGEPVLDEILARAPASIELMGSALLLSLMVGIPLGIGAAVKRGGWLDRLVSGLSVAGISVPAFWLGLVMVILFYRQLEWFPASGRFTGDPPPSLTGFLLIDALIALDFRALSAASAHLALPVLSLALLEAGPLARLVRNQMRAVLASDYVRMARASGLSERTILWRHALRNALTPLVTLVAASIAMMLFGSVSLETVFGWPGAGHYVVQSIFALDFPVIMGFAVLTAIAYVMVNTAADITLGLIDPRVRPA